MTRGWAKVLQSHQRLLSTAKDQTTHWQHSPMGSHESCLSPHTFSMDAFSGGDSSSIHHPHGLTLGSTEDNMERRGEDWSKEGGGITTIVPQIIWRKTTGQSAWIEIPAEFQSYFYTYFHMRLTLLLFGFFCQILKIWNPDFKLLRFLFSWLHRI